MGNATAHQRLASHIEACEQKMSCVYARTAAEAKQIERRVAAGSLEVVMPGLYARPEYWSELKFRQRYLHRVRGDVARTCSTRNGPPARYTYRK